MDATEKIVENEKYPMDRYVKFVALKASPSIVAVVTHDIPDDMLINRYKRPLRERERDCEYVFEGSGIIIECCRKGDSSGGGSGSGGGSNEYISIIICAAILFKRTNRLEPKDIQVDVYQSNGKLYRGQLLACDFHYNLAAIRIESDSPLQIATIRGLDDVSFTDLTEQPQLCEKQPFQLRPHSSLFKIHHGTRLITLDRSGTPPFRLHVRPGNLSPDTNVYSNLYGCKELLWVADSNFRGNGAPIFNCYSEVVGIMFNRLCFLPSNLVSRWWNHFKTCGEFRRPWLRLKVSHLYEASVGFLDELARRFSNIDKGVVVTKVKEDSSDLQPDDVIVKINDLPVRSRLEFLERIWDNAGKSVKLSYRRANNGHQGTASMTIKEVTPDKFNWWDSPIYSTLKST